MISSIRYKSKSKILSLSSTFIPNKRFIFEILIVKAALLILMFTLPPIMNEEFLCILVTILVAIDFWTSKNLGRKFLCACWYINTEGEEDEWVYEASLKSPTEIYEALFWYSFLMFGILMLVMGILSLVVSKLSLACAILIGFVANYINFYAFSNIIEMRNEGILQMISDEVQGEGVGETIKLPLVLVSKLEEIPEQNSM